MGAGAGAGKGRLAFSSVRKAPSGSNVHFHMIFIFQTGAEVWGNDWGSFGLGVVGSNPYLCFLTPQNGGSPGPFGGCLENFMRSCIRKTFVK